jgi:alanine racemase
LPIFVISISPSEAADAAAYSLSPSISNQEEAEALNQQGRQHNKIIPVHLHLDTGMNRFGSSIGEANNLYTTIMQASNLCLEGLWTHFVSAESEMFDSFSFKQILCFKQFLDSLPIKPKWIHIANSAGAVRFDLSFCNLARIGLGYVGYGTSLPTANKALSLTTRLSAIKYAQKGESVSYHRSHIVTQDNTRIGVIPFGYFDGFPRVLSGQGYVLICGKKAPIIGVICMDFTMIDLSNIPEANVGDQVTIFDSNLSPEVIASWAQTDVREILAHLPHRIKRVWIHDDCSTNSKRFSSPPCSIEKSTSA